MSKIEWCDETINPLGWGCYGTGTADAPRICPGCYAYAMSKRSLRDCDLCNKFIPHTHFEYLNRLRHWKKPRTVFVQSMGDLFGEWVSDEDIRTVFKACYAAPQHRYIFLTKNPKRYLTMPIANPPATWWFGTSVSNGNTPAFYSSEHNTFLSVEPLTGEFGYVPTIGMFTNWVIVGAMTGREAKNYPVKREWVENIVSSCKAANIPVFLKDNLSPVMGEDYVKKYQLFPWEVR